MIIFKKLRYKNFLSTGDIFTEIDLNTSPNTLIVGENGSGKSAILDALCFSLFGKAFRNVVKGSLVNSINDKNCLVEIEFSTNNKNYRICRGIKPIIFEIYCDGTLVNQDSASRDYQLYLEKNILKMTYKSFTQIVILGSASYFPFMQLKPADRRVIIEDLLDIQIFSVMNTVVKTKSQLNKEELSKNGSSILLLKEKIELTKKTIKSITAIKEKSITDLQDKKSSYSKTIDVHKANILGLNINREDLLKIEKDCSTIMEKLVKHLKMKAQFQANIRKLSETIKFFEHEQNCPICKQTIDETFKIDSIADNKEKLAKLNEGLASLDAKISQLEEEHKDLAVYKIELDKVNTQITTQESMIKSITTIIKDIDKEINSATSSSTTLDEYNDELINTQKELEATEKAREVLLQDKTYIETAILLLKDGGIKTKIIKQYLPIINSTINKYLSQMGFFVNFHIDENFEEVIKSRHRDEFSYNSFSEGEKFRIDLAILLTWRHIARLRNSVNCNLLILDEIFDGSLDVNGIDEFLKIMWSLFDNTNVFVISHKTDMMLDKFKTVYRLKKVKNFSEIQA